MFVCLCILNNQVATSICACTVTGSERDRLGFVSGSRLWEPVRLLFARDARVVVLGLSGLRKEISPRSLWLTSLRSNLIQSVFYVCIIVVVLRHKYC